MTSPNRKFRSSITSTEELEIVLLKQCVLATLAGGYAVSYKLRCFIYPFEGEFVVNKTEDLAANVAFREGQLGSAVDFFIDSFIHEANCDLGNVLFHREDPAGVATSWTTLNNHCGISNLLAGSIAQVIDVLTVIPPKTHESTFRTPEVSGSRDEG